MSIEATLETKLLAEFDPQRLKIDNDSKRHAGPATESHFQVIIVSEAFTGRMRFSASALFTLVLRRSSLVRSTPCS